MGEKVNYQPLKELAFVAGPEVYNRVVAYLIYRSQGLRLGLILSARYATVDLRLLMPIHLTPEGVSILGMYAVMSAPQAKAWGIH